jgi:hypothetical protein
LEDVVRNGSKIGWGRADMELSARMGLSLQRHEINLRRHNEIWGLLKLISCKQQKEHKGVQHIYFEMKL